MNEIHLNTKSKDMDFKKPPKLASQLLKWYCKTDLWESIDGDLHEEFAERINDKGVTVARLYYWLAVISFLRPFSAKKPKFKNMGVYRFIFKNHLKTSYRNMVRDKASSLVNLSGLALSLFIAMFIFVIVRHDLTYDQFHDNSDRIFRLTHDETKLHPTSNRHLSTVGPPVGPAISTFYPEIENYVRFRYTPTGIISYKENRFYEENIFYVDSTVFDVFSYELINGNPHTALREPNSVVLTKPMAEKYFGRDDPLGQVIYLNNETGLKVTGVLKPIPGNTHFEFDFLLPFHAFKVPFGYPVTLDDWGWISFHTYLLLREDADPVNLESKFPDFIDKNWPQESRLFQFRLQPLQNIYFGNVYNDIIASGNKTYTYGLMSAGILILFLATFNFTNLFIAKSFVRAKETGVRKSLGARKITLFFQFILESVFQTSISFIFAIIMVTAAAPYANSLLAAPIVPVGAVDYPLLAGIFFSISLFLGIIAGIYPAGVIANFKPVKVLKGHFITSISGIWVRKTLLTFQFIISTSLIAASLVVHKQIDFLYNKDLGFNKEHIGLLQMPGVELDEKYEALKTRYENNSLVTAVSVGGGRMDGDSGNVPIYTEGNESIPMNILSVRYGFFETLEIPMIAGREFSQDYPGDSARAIIINQKACQTFGWNEEEAIGKKIRVDQIREGNVIGVARDFNFNSLHEPIAPLIITYPRTHLTDVYLKFNTQLNPNILVALENDWKAIAPDVPFDFVLLDRHLQSLYFNELKFSKLSNLFSTAAIIIASLGLLSLISIILQQKIKEFSIRKVLGASVIGLTKIISGPIFWLIIIANLIAWPITYFYLQRWMAGFAYKINLSIWFFSVTALIVIFIAAVIIGLKIVNIQSINPSKVLRNE